MPNDRPEFVELDFLSAHKTNQQIQFALNLRQSGDGGFKKKHSVTYESMEIEVTDLSLAPLIVTIRTSTSIVVIFFLVTGSEPKMVVKSALL